MVTGRFPIQSEARATLSLLNPDSQRSALDVYGHPRLNPAHPSCSQIRFDSALGAGLYSGFGLYSFSGFSSSISVIPDLAPGYVLVVSWTLDSVLVFPGFIWSGMDSAQPLCRRPSLKALKAFTNLLIPVSMLSHGFNMLRVHGSKHYVHGIMSYTLHASRSIFSRPLG